jgi:hypothetical protein
MSVQAVSRIAALLALDAEQLKKYVPAFAEDDYDQETDLNEANRARFAYLYRHQLTDQEREMIAEGDMNATVRYIADHLEKPVNGESTEIDLGGG